MRVRSYVTITIDDDFRAFFFKSSKQQQAERVCFSANLMVCLFISIGSSFPLKNEQTQH